MSLSDTQTWTVRSSVQTAFRIGYENFTAFFIAALLFSAPAFVLEMRGVEGLPKYAVDFAGNVAAYIVILCGALNALDEHPLGIQATLGQVNRPALPGLLALCVVQSLAIALGALLIVPALYLMTLWAIAVPAMLVEGTGAGDSLRRSAELTDGRRWRVLGAVVMCLLVVALLFGAASALLSAVPIATERSTLQSILQWLLAGAAAAFVYPLSAVLYVALRQEKEGGTIAQIVGTLG